MSDSAPLRKSLRTACDRIEVAKASEPESKISRKPFASAKATRLPGVPRSSASMRQGAHCRFSAVLWLSGFRCSSCICDRLAIYNLLVSRSPSILESWLHGIPQTCSPLAQTKSTTRQVGRTSRVPGPKMCLTVLLNFLLSMSAFSCSQPGRETNPTASLYSLNAVSYRMPMHLAARLGA